MSVPRPYSPTRVCNLPQYCNPQSCPGPFQSPLAHWNWVCRMALCLSRNSQQNQYNEIGTLVYWAMLALLMACVATWLAVNTIIISFVKNKDFILLGRIVVQGCMVILLTPSNAFSWFFFASLAYRAGFPIVSCARHRPNQHWAWESTLTLSWHAYLFCPTTRHFKLQMWSMEGRRLRHRWPLVKTHLTHTLSWFIESQLSQQERTYRVQLLLGR